jgi:hypothetical protein
MGSRMQKSVWRWVRAFWRHTRMKGAVRLTVRNDRQLEQSCREHGMLWLVDGAYADSCPATVAIQRRLKATR